MKRIELVEKIKKYLVSIKKIFFRIIIGLLFYLMIGIIPLKILSKEPILVVITSLILIIPLMLYINTSWHVFGCEFKGPTFGWNCTLAQIFAILLSIIILYLLGWFLEYVIKRI